MLLKGLKAICEAKKSEDCINFYFVIPDNKKEDWKSPQSVKYYKKEVSNNEDDNNDDVNNDDNNDDNNDNGNNDDNEKKKKKKKLGFIYSKINLKSLGHETYNLVKKVKQHVLVLSTDDDLKDISIDSDSN
jgi:hypothetical protein